MRLETRGEYSVRLKLRTEENFHFAANSKKNAANALDFAARKP
jgi:hypothetical protein